MTMDEILQLERYHQRQVFEAQMQTARYEAISKAIQDTLSAFWIIHQAQITALVYAGMNPNFCKPKDAP